MTQSHPTWKTPMPVGDETLKCSLCEWTCPRWYRNQSDKPNHEPRDGHVRLNDHVSWAHPQEFWNMRRQGEW